ncbi:Hsp33 family molecular chaperone [Marinicauda salina]|uniref:Hsp33 family molecular chaperone n=1 Tax=Marinicauda salina TaxID=2135793 RepID=A0A2U2BXV0_9PROT|nr:Hsp33 family molecular chaperone [Marinicauda salina]PWE18836.1 Hsp33 family molecular chaperone [Marinicauda salina]
MAENTTPSLGELGGADDIVAAFQLERRPVRGRIARLGPVADKILSAHDYPDSVGALAGEAVLLALLIGDALKFEGRLIVQASGRNESASGIEGRGAVSFVVADYTTGEGVRAFAKYDAEAVAAIEAEHGPRPGAETLLGPGVFAMTIDQGADTDRYQGVVEIDGPTLAASAEHYFRQSEQVPTRIRLAVGQEMVAGGETRWRAGGALIQKIAEGEAEDADPDAFENALALFETTEDAELLDPDVSAGRLLFRLFHEDGVRLYESRSVERRCTCERERLARILASFSDDDQAHMMQDGEIVMTCEYCNIDWKFAPEEVEAAGRN